MSGGLSNISITVIYNSKDISTTISEYIISLQYVDNTEGHSDTIELSLDDSQQLWSNSWYPIKGDTIQVFITQDKVTLELGTFKVDEIEQSSPPDIFIIKAIATPNTGSLRTKKSSAHETKTLLQIVTSIAQNNSLTVLGKIDNNIIINRVTQNRETDLEFLYRISHEYGYIFSIRDTTITFYSIYDLEDILPVATLDKSQLSSFRIVDKSIGTYIGAVNVYQDPIGGGTITGTATQNILNKDNIDFNIIVTDDTLVSQKRAENQQQAEAKTKAALYRKNSFQQEGFINLPGNIYVISGNNISITSIGKNSGVYHVFTAYHKLDKRSGYTVNAKIKRVGFAQKVYAKKHKKPRKYTVSVVK